MPLPHRLEQHQRRSHRHVQRLGLPPHRNDKRVIHQLLRLL